MLLLMLACTKDVPPVTDDSGVGGDDSGDDTGTSDDPASPTPGPALPECTPQQGTNGLVSLSGVLLLPEGPVAGVLVFDPSTGLIDCAGAECDDTGAERICTGGVISPGLIDAHDHMQYNALPPWDHGDKLFTDRYDWQDDPDYWAYGDILDGLDTCEIGRWAELRALMGGATSVVGSSGGDCLAGALRNLDQDESTHGLSDFDMDYSSGKVKSKVDAELADETTAELASGVLECAAYHVAEGVNGGVSDELDHMAEVGAEGKGWAYVHATDASVEHIARLAQTGTAILWSPRSNLSLYDGTTPVDLALRMGVPVAVGPDWTPSGSINQKEELACADEYLRFAGTPHKDSEILGLGTSQAAKILGLEGELGSLVPGARADIAVFAWSDTPYRAVLDAAPGEVLRVYVDGELLVGPPEELPGCETLDVCGASLAVCGEVAALESALQADLDKAEVDADLEYATQLYPLFSCEPAPDPCTPIPGADADADDIGTGDLCPDVYDPAQGDHDGDAVGDACDPCPLMPGTEGCRMAPQDIDDDGVAADDDCPYNHDPGQEDGDADGIGDACDACPEQPGNACTVSIVDVQTGLFGEGERVAVAGVVTGVDEGAGFYMQESTEEYSAIFVYGDDGVSEGDSVVVSGTVSEYYDMTQLVDPAVTVVGVGTMPSPVVVDACTLGDAADGEPWESMLVRVEGVTVSDSNPDSPDDYGVFEVEGCLYVDDSIDKSYDAHPAVDTAYSSITGLAGWSFDHRRLNPRNAADIVE